MLHMIPDKLVSSTEEEQQESQSGESVGDGKAPGKIHKVPRRVRLDSEIVIKVKLVSLQAMKAVAPGGQELSGLWDDCNKIIYIDKILSLDNQWEILRHELLHAIIDIDHEVRINISK